MSKVIPLNDRRKDYRAENCDSRPVNLCLLEQSLPSSLPVFVQANLEHLEELSLGHSIFHYSAMEMTCRFVVICLSHRR